MAKDYYFEVLGPIKDYECHNPVKCYFPNTPHIDCGPSFIVTSKLTPLKNLPKQTQERIKGHCTDTVT